MENQNSNQEVKKEYPKNVGGVWVKENDYGKYFSMSVTIDGVKHDFVGYPNRFKQEGDNKPNYQIFPKKKTVEAPF